MALLGGFGALLARPGGLLGEVSVPEAHARKLGGAQEFGDFRGLGLYEAHNLSIHLSGIHRAEGTVADVNHGIW